MHVAIKYFSNHGYVHVLVSSQAVDRAIYTHNHVHVYNRDVNSSYYKHFTYL